MYDLGVGQKMNWGIGEQNADNGIFGAVRDDIAGSDESCVTRLQFVSLIDCGRSVCCYVRGAFLLVSMRQSGNFPSGISETTHLSGACL